MINFINKAFTSLVIAFFDFIEYKIDIIKRRNIKFFWALIILGNTYFKKDKDIIYLCNAMTNFKNDTYN